MKHVEKQENTAHTQEKAISQQEVSLVAAQMLDLTRWTLEIKYYKYAVKN